MAITRINNNQITDSVAGNFFVGVNAATKLQDFSVTSGKIANNLTYNSDLTVTGNLTVQGNTTAIDTVNLVVEDPLILLAKEQTGAPALDIGFIGKRGTEDNIAFVWDESADQFVAVFTTSEVTNSTININSYASLQVLDLTAANANITGNLTFNGSVIGNVDVTGNITGGNLISDAAVDAVTITASGNLVGNNAVITGDVGATTVTASGNVAGGNITTAGVVEATGNVIGGNITTAGVVAATGNVSGGNVTTAGNVDGANVNATSGITAGTTIVATGNVTGGNLTTAGNVDGANVNASAGITAGTTIIATGNVSGGNITTAGVVDATGNVTGGNVNTGGVVIATGNVTGGNVTTAGNVDGANINASAGITAGTTIIATGNVSGGNITTAGNIDGANVNATAGITAGTTIIATGNVSGGNVTTAGNVVATGNVDGGNVNAATKVTATTVTASGNVDAGTAVNANLIAGTSVQINSTGDIVLNPTGNINVSGVRVRNMSEPQLAFDAATKQYVDDAVSAGIHVHPPVDVETTAPLTTVTYANGGNVFTVNETIAGNTVVFTTAANLQVNDQLWFDNSFNGVVGNLAYFVVSTPNTSAAVLTTAYNGVPVSNITSGSGLSESVRVNSGVGATLTATANGAIVVDGVSLSAGNRVLVNDQLNQIENGVYEVTDAGNVTAPYILTRSSDADTYEPQTSSGLDQGSYFYVESGDVGAGASYVKTAPSGPFIFGVANIVFTQFSSSQVYSANTQAGLVLNGTVFSAKVDNDTTAFDGGGNIIVKASANLTTPNIGDATGNSLTLGGNGLLSATTVSATGNVSGGNLTTAGDVTTATVTASGNVAGGNITTAGVVEATGNVIGGNLTTAGAVVATGNVTGGNVNTAGQVVATGNVSGGNISAGSGTIVTTGNIDGGNINATANVTGTGAVFSGNVTADTFIGNISGNIDAGGANTNIQFNDDDVLAGSAAFTFDKVSNAVVATGNITGGNLDTAGTVVATGNVTGGNVNTAGTVVATGNVTGGNVNTGGQVVATGNVTGGNVNTAGTVIATGNVDAGNVNSAGQVVATGNVTGGNLVTTGAADLGNIRITGNDITNFASNIITINSAASDIDVRISGDTVANLLLTDAGTDTVVIGGGNATTGAALKVDTTDSMMVPVGNTLQRPGSPEIGMFRFNTGGDALEVYTSGGWEDVGVPAFTVIVADAFVGNGVQTIFTLSSNSTTAGTIVAINGIVQEPTTAYSVSGTTLTFTEAPAVSDNIDARILTTTTTVTNIENISGNAVVEVLETADTVQITGNILPLTSNIYNLGSTSLRWNELFLQGSTITLGNVVIKNTTGNTIGFFGPDGTTPGAIDTNNIDSAGISNGTSSVQVIASGGNIRANVGGSTVGLFSSSGLVVTGSIEATNGFIGLDASKISNGTSNVAVIASNGNVDVNVGGSPIVTFYSGGIDNRQSNGVGNIGTASSQFNTIFAKATSAQYADLAEMYEADAMYEPGTVLCFGGTKEVTLCGQTDSTRVAGVVSTNPSYLMNSGQTGDNVVAVALQGRVPCRVTGTICKGDLIVSTGDGRGRANNAAAVGTVIGKALADFDGTDGVIEVVVGRV